MALGPNHKRNNNKGEQFVAAKIIRAKTVSYTHLDVYKRQGS